MNTLRILVVLGATAITAFSQGTLQFNNHIAGVVDARVVHPDGAGVGAGWTAQLYAGTEAATSDRLTPLTPATSFRTGSHITEGYVDPVSILVPGMEPEAMAKVVVRAYNGASFENSLFRGESPPVLVRLGGGLVPPAVLEGLQGFTVAPHPQAAKITASASAYGAIQPQGTLYRFKGETQSFTAYPYANYEVDQWLVNGAEAQAGGSAFVLTATESSHEVVVRFKPSSMEGTVVLNNRVSGLVDARVMLSDGTGAGAGWTAQLYGGAEGAAELKPLFPATTFRTTSAATQGYVHAVNVSVPGVVPGAAARLVLRVYQGESYETAARRGQSAPITVTLGGGVLTPANLVGLHGFTVPLEDPLPPDHGLVNFNNRVPGLVEARVLLADGSGAGAGWTAQLYGGPAGGEIRPLFPKATFRTSSADAQGYINPVVVSLPHVRPGSKATLMMKAYNGASFETSALFGESAPITVTVGGGVEPPPNLIGLEGFRIKVQAPVIVSQPVSQTVLAGSTAAFHVIAQGGGALSYQWTFNGQAMAGANSASLVMNNVQLAQAGTYRVTISSAAGSLTSAEAQLTVLAGSASGDFNGDGRADLLFQDDDGFLAVWFMEDADLKSASFLAPNHPRDKGWRMSGVGDFNRDGREDLLFQHDQGALAVWTMRGTTRTSALFLDPASPGDEDWRVAATGDYNRDGKVDLMLQHHDGTLAVWYMDGVKLTAGALVEPSHPGDANWRVVGGGDLDADGHSDLVFQHEDGTLAAWHLQGGKLQKAALLRPSHPIDPQWRVASVVDLNRDRRTDLVFQHRDGSLAVWFMEGTELSLAQLLNPEHPGHTWSVLAP